MHMYRFIDGVDHQLTNASAALAVITAVVMLTSLSLGVFYRYFLQSALPWTGEVALLSFTWTIFLLGSAMVRNAEHVRVTLALSIMPQYLEEVVERFILLLVLGFGAVMFWYGWQYAVFTAGQVSPAIRYPLWLLNASVPVGGALISLHAFVRVISPCLISGQDAGVIND